MQDERTDKLKEFLDKIHALRPAVGSHGGIFTTTDTIPSLQHASVTFARLIHNQAPQPEINAAADVVEGYINVLQATGQMSMNDGQKLTEKLHDIADPPSSPFALDV